jgi:hypothetical protein
MTHVVQVGIGKHPIGSPLEEGDRDVGDPLDVRDGDEGCVVRDSNVDLGRCIRTRKEEDLVMSHCSKQERIWTYVSRSPAESDGPDLTARSQLGPHLWSRSGKCDSRFWIVPDPLDESVQHGLDN